MEAGFQVIHAAFHAGDVIVQVFVDRAVASVDLEEFGTLVEGGFVMMLAGAIHNDAAGLGQRGYSLRPMIA